MKKIAIIRSNLLQWHTMFSRITAKRKTEIDISDKKEVDIILSKFYFKARKQNGDFLLGNYCHLSR